MDYFELANKQIAVGKSEALVKASLDKAYKAKHQQEFYAQQRADYDVLYPATEEVTCLTHTVNVDTGVCDVCGNAEEVVTQPLEQAMTYEQYRDEVTVITPYQEATYDADGNILTEEVLEVTEPVRPYVAPLQSEIDTLVTTNGTLVSYQAKIASENLSKTLDNLTVTTTSGKVFDAYITARQNMADAILASATLNLTETIWRLADNTEVLVTLDELKEAHALALQAYATTKGIG